MAAQTPIDISPITPLPPILALPLELKQQSMSHLSGEDNQFNINVGSRKMIILRRKHPEFRSIIPCDYRFASQSVFHKRWQLFVAACTYPYLIPPNLYPCYQCVKVLDVSDYARDNASAEGVTPIGARGALHLFCDGCWVARDKDHRHSYAWNQL